MRATTILAVTLAVATTGVACTKSPTAPESMSSVAASAAATEARGGGGGGGKKPGGGGTSGGSSSLTLVMVTDNNANGLPNWGDSITWNISTTATTEPNVSVDCQQNGVNVYSTTSGYYASYPWPWTQTMTLSSDFWQSGAASCTATLSYINGTSSIILTSINFNVGA